MNAPAPATVQAWCLVGATATGKTAVAHVLAERLSLPVLSLDSMMVYRGMDIGTAKPDAAERLRHGYLGLDLVDPGSPFTVSDYVREVGRALAARGVREVIACGGTGLYLAALLRGIDAGPAPDAALRAELEALHARGGLEALHERLRASGGADGLAPGDARNPRRVMRAIERAASGAPRGSGWADGPRPVLAGLRLERPALSARIQARVTQMFDHGLVDEAVRLRARGPWSSTAAQAIGYAEALAVADGTLSRPRAEEAAAARTRQYARRQDTWFRRQENVAWVDRAPADHEAALADRVQAIWDAHGPALLRLPAFDTPAGAG